MAASDYPNLLSPIVLGRQFFKHRIFASPQDNPQLDANKFLTRDAMAFYERKAQGGFASVCVGDFMVDSRAGHSHPFQLRGDDVRGKASMFRTAMGITKHGAVAAAELNHAGVNSNMWEQEGFVYGSGPTVWRSAPLTMPGWSGSSPALPTRQPMPGRWASR